MEFGLGKDESGAEDSMRFFRAGESVRIDWLILSVNCGSVDACWCSTSSNSAFKFLLTRLLESLGKLRIIMKPLQTAWILLAASYKF